MEVSKRIKALMEAKGYTVNRLANIAGISQSFVREIELGNKNPTVETVASLCDALDISLKEFFDDESASSLQSSELLSQIYKLNATQRELLTKFLQSLE